MDLIDRYIGAVRRHLPKSANPDIVSELTDNLRSQAEEREQALGRALNDEEQAELLKPHGHPWLMASRYMPQQHLIGPAMYPYYRQTVSIAVYWVVLPIGLVGGAVTALYSDHPSLWFSRMLSSAWNGAIYAVGIVTIVFAFLEHERVKFTALENWNPRRLPAPGQRREIPRSETVIGLVFQIAFLIYWTKVVGLPDFILYDGARVQFTADPIWQSARPPDRADDRGQHRRLAGRLDPALADDRGVDRRHRGQHRRADHRDRRLARRPLHHADRRAVRSCATGAGGVLAQPVDLVDVCGGGGDQRRHGAQRDVAAGQDAAGAGRQIRLSRTLRYATPIISTMTMPPGLSPFSQV